MESFIIKTMRWYGERDLLSLADLKQAGITGIVTALHHIPVGDIWTSEAIKETKDRIEGAGLVWEVVESLPVHENIKKRTGNFQELIENYKLSIENLAKQGIHTITFNFMPILDWVRTDHRHLTNTGASVLKFDPIKLRIFDLYILKRPNAELDYSVLQITQAKQSFENYTDKEIVQLKKNVLLGLPGSTEDFTTQELLMQLEDYKTIYKTKLREHLISFLKAITPTADDVGSKLAIHPDDPPFSVLGLPRIVSNLTDLEFIFSSIESMACGLCYCTGSLGSHSENQLIEIYDKFKERIHFLHLRNVKKFEDGTFLEADHLEGDVPMKSIMQCIIDYTSHTGIKIPMRPDHGYLHSLEEHKNYYAGYSFIGRLKGLAELTGLELGLHDF